MTKQLVRNQDLASDVFRRNQLTNGGMSSTQRGTGPFTVNNAYTADRWQLLVGGTSTISITCTSQGLSGPLGANVPALVGSYVQSSADSAVQQYVKFASDGHLGLLAGQQVSFSMKVYTATPNSLRLRLLSDGATPLNVFSAYHPGNGSTQMMTLSGLVPVDATFVIAQVYLSVTNPSFSFSNAMLVIGSVAAEYVPLPTADDWTRCLRYYEILGDPPGAGGMVFYLYGPAAGVAGTFLPFKARKPVAPTTTKVGTWAVTNSSQPSFLTSINDGVTIIANPTALGTAQFGNNATGACVTVEANP